MFSFSTLNLILHIFNYSKCVLVNLRQFFFFFFYKVFQQIPLFSPQESGYFKEIVGYLFKKFIFVQIKSLK